MRSKIVTAATIAALFLGTSASADPPNDCGVNICYPGQNCTSTYCGEYTPVGGGLLLCACSNGRVCVDSTNDVNEIGPDGLQVPGLCTTPSSFSCDNISRFCEGHAYCVGGQCCVPNPCPANFCGEVDTGCGEHTACTTLAGCVDPITLTITPEFPGEPVHQFDWTGVNVHGPGAHQFNLTFRDPDGNITYLVEQTDDNGNWSGYVGGSYGQQFDLVGMWIVTAEFQHSRTVGWWQSNTIDVDVVQ